MEPVVSQDRQRLGCDGQEYAEVCFVPRMARKKDGPVFRYLAIREVWSSRLFLGWMSRFSAVSDHELGSVKYKVSGRHECDIAGDELIWWSGSVRKIGRGAFDHEGRSCRGQASFGVYRGKRSMVAHHDPGLEPELGEKRLVWGKHGRASV